MKTDDGRQRLHGLAVPFGAPQLIAELGADGKRSLYFELFDRESFASLPPKLPLTRRHDTDSPAGWAAVRIADRGLEVQGEFTEGSPTAADTLAAVRDGLITGLSISFLPSENTDRWTRGSGGRAPTVLRRGAVLDHVAVVSRPAYAAAKISSVGVRTWQQDESDRVMQPYLAAKARARATQQTDTREFLADVAKRRADRQAFMADTLALCRSRGPDGSLTTTAPTTAAPPAAGGSVTLQLGGQRLRVSGTEDVDTAAARAAAAWQYAQLAGRSYGAGAFDLRDYLADQGIELLPALLVRDTPWS